MKVNVTFGEHSVSYDVPESVHFIGCSISYDNGNLRQWHFTAENIERNDVEIMNEHGLRVVVHCYSCPILAEIAEDLKAFEGMPFLEGCWKEIGFSIVL